MRNECTFLCLKMFSPCSSSPQTCSVSIIATFPLSLVSHRLIIAADAEAKAAGKSFAASVKDQDQAAKDAAFLLMADLIVLSVAKGVPCHHQFCVKMAMVISIALAGRGFCMFVSKR